MKRKAITKYLVEQKMHQIELADELGWTRQKLWRVINGQDLGNDDVLALYTATNGVLEPNHLYNLPPLN